MSAVPRRMNEAESERGGVRCGGEAPGRGCSGRRASFDGGSGCEHLGTAAGGSSSMPARSSHPLLLPDPLHGDLCYKHTNIRGKNAS
ncbi:hypothetical protein ZWY2020_018282 [Hordeum vulgare]|nr:hypothetical protein ZWY2020_018282 [Hordeum vulgare]